MNTQTQKTNKQNIMKTTKTTNKIKRPYNKNRKAEFVVVTKKWWQGASPEIHSKHSDKKKALDKAHSLYDNNLRGGQNAFVLSKSAFKKKYPAIFREEY